MGSDKRIACDETVFHNLREQKEEMGYDWNGYLKWLYEEANATHDAEGVDFTPVMNRIDDLETEITNQHERMGGR